MRDLPPSPSDEAVQRHRDVVIAGHRGDEATVRAHISDSAPLVRVAALAALARLGLCDVDTLSKAYRDESPRVRARGAELAVSVARGDPTVLLDDPDATVVEVACFSCGEIEWGDNAPVAKLASIATSHDEPLCREAAAAALGAIGDPAGLDAVLVACGDRVTVRRRATLALAAFDDPRADAALRAALDDNDWQVRQAAEDLLEVGRVLDGPEDPDAYAL